MAAACESNPYRNPSYSPSLSLPLPPSPSLSLPLPPSPSLSLTHSLVVPSSLRAYEQKQKALRLFGCRGLARAVQSFLVVCGRRAVTAGVVGAALARSHVWRRSLVRLSRALCPSVAHTPFREVHRPQMGAAATQHARQGVMSGPVLGIVTRVGPDGSAEILRSFDRCYNNAVKNTGTCVSVGGRSC